MSEKDSSQEDFVRLFSRHEGSVRAFVASLLPSWEGVDEVLQEASVVMWRKFDQFDRDREGSSFLNWAFMIARYEALMYRRKKATDRLVFSEDVFELLAAEANEIIEAQPLRREALAKCMLKLKPSQQELVHVVYTDGISIKDAAAKVGRTPTGLYKALARIRQMLQRCIRLTVSELKLEEGS